MGCGFLEKIYENALAIELSRAGVRFEQQYPLRVFYDNFTVGEFTADLLVENSVIIELKAVRAFDNVHAAQCMNYLRASSLKVCLLINFGRPRVEIKRIVSNY